MKEQKSLAKDILFTTLVLVIIAVIAGGILGVVNHFTQIDEREVLNKKLAEIYPTDGGFTDNLYKDGVTSSDPRGGIIGVYRAEGKNAVVFHVLGNGAYKQTIELMILIEDYEIHNIMKYRAEETPGLGAEAFKEKHYKQYLNKDIREMQFVIKKGGKGNIDAVSGATKTSTAMNNCVSLAVEYYIANYNTLVGGAN